MFKKIIIALIIVVIVIFAAVHNTKDKTVIDSLQISYLRSRTYVGSNLKIEQTLAPQSNYNRYIASYISDGLKIYGLLTVPKGAVPSGGWPAIIFNHGYITPEKYTSDGNYVAYVDNFSRNGYVVFKPDYRGNGKSEGISGSAYFSKNYDIDDLNALASVAKYKNVNPKKIGVWGHSMGGHITLTDLVISKHIKAAVVWGGVVGDYSDIIYNWQNRVSYKPDIEDLHLRNLELLELFTKHGTPADNPNFWDSIDPISNLQFVNTPVQIHVGLADNQVPSDFSEELFSKLKNLGKPVELYTYQGDDHNISYSFNLAMQRSIEFFDKYLK
jgi:dipeptidyl aminopeptidase/acylaminoacyl peptidase